jgi:hypothetical protein
VCTADTTWSVATSGDCDDADPTVRGCEAARVRSATTGGVIHVFEAVGDVDGDGRDDLAVSHGDYWSTSVPTSGDTLLDTVALVEAARYRLTSVAIPCHRPPPTLRL